MPYNTTESRAVLTREVGWEYYGRKHAESCFTKFFQGYYLPKKFGYNKRRAHLCLIVSREITREQALEQLQEPLYDPNELQLDEIMAPPTRPTGIIPAGPPGSLPAKKSRAGCVK